MRRPNHRYTRREHLVPSRVSQTQTSLHVHVLDLAMEWHIRPLCCVFSLFVSFYFPVYLSLLSSVLPSLSEPIYLSVHLCLPISLRPRASLCLFFCPSLLCLCLSRCPLSVSILCISLPVPCPLALFSLASYFLTHALNNALALLHALLAVGAAGGTQGSGNLWFCEWTAALVWR